MTLNYTNFIGFNSKFSLKNGHRVFAVFVAVLLLMALLPALTLPAMAATIDAEGQVVHIYPDATPVTESLVDYHLSVGEASDLSVLYDSAYKVSEVTVEKYGTITYSPGRYATGSEFSEKVLIGSNYIIKSTSEVGMSANTGYQFTGWNTRDDNRGTFYFSGSTMQSFSDSNLVLYAIYNRVVVMSGVLPDGGFDGVEWVNSGGGGGSTGFAPTAITVSSSDGVTVYDAVGTDDLANPLYVFEDGFYYRVVIQYSLPDVAAEYSVTYVSGAVDTTGSVPVDGNFYKYNEDVMVLGQGGLLRSGYTFAGWKATAQVATLTVPVAPFVAQAPQSVKDLETADAVDLFLSGYAIHGYLWSEQDFTKPFMHVQAAPIAGVDGLGELTFSNLPFGTYYLMITRNGYLSRIAEVTISASSPPIVKLVPPVNSDDNGVFRLWAGDVDQDGKVDNNDLGVVMPYLTQGTTFVGDVLTGGVPLAIFAGCDLNADGIIDNVDVDMAGGSSEWWNKSVFDYPDVTSISNYLDVVNALLYANRDDILMPVNDFKLGGVYLPGDVFLMPGGSVTLTAQWIPNAVGVDDEFCVVYRGNGNSGGVAPVDSKVYLAGDRVIVLGQGSLVRDGYVFLGWSTNPAASAATFVAGSTFTIQNDDVTLYAIWSPNLYTVTYQPGTHGTFTTQTTNGLHYGDTTPTAPTVTGEVGWIFTGWSPVPSATVTGNATYVAQWTQTAPAPTLSPSSSATPSPSATAPPTTSTPSTSAPSATASTTSTPAPSTSVTPPATYDVNDAEGTWALVNLILAIIGVVLAGVAAVFVLPDKKQQQSKQKSGQGTVEEQKTRKHSLLWLFAGVVLAVVGVLVFLVTEDWSLSRAWVDSWTVVNIVILVVEAVALVFAFRCIKTKDATKVGQNKSSTTTPNTP